MDITSTSREQHRNVFVLSGGAARGAVQVGMMEVLLEHGIVPDAFVGTSVGALNSAFMGWRADLGRVRDLRQRWLRLGTRDIFPGGTLARMGHLIRQRPYLFSSAALQRLISDWVPTRNLEDLPTPVRVVTTPLAGDTAVYHRHGDLNMLLRASAAVPAVFSPVHLPESCGHPGPHVDGGVAAWCRSAVRPTWHRPGCSSSTPACRPGFPPDGPRSTSSSPASAWPPGCGPSPTSAPV